jgi:hypothetical protein
MERTRSIGRACAGADGVGVSKRGYAHSLEPLPEAVIVRGVSKSAVSERFAYGTERRVREIGRRVKRWQNGTMVLPWSAAGVLEAERGFRKLVGYRAMPILIAALRAQDAQFNRTERRVDGTEKAVQ